MKNQIMDFAKKFLDKFKADEKASPQNIEKVPLSADAIDLDTLEEQDRGNQVAFYDTENSTVSKGAPKAVPIGLDSFGEKDTFDPEVADDYQTNRDRNQNSDLANRYYTRGLDIDQKDTHR